VQRITIDPTQLRDTEIALTAAQHHYLVRVLRLQAGECFQAIDGTGVLYRVELTTTSQSARIVDTIVASNASTLSITLICALPKGNHFDDIVRACTELGVTRILPALSERTLLDPSPQKLQRWRKIAQEAAEQSERLEIPLIDDPQALQPIFEGVAAIPNSAKYLCEARGDRPHLLNCLQDRQSPDSNIILAIGPEGGWTDGELKLAIACNFQLVSLGRQILRTITAPIVALSIVSAAVAARSSR
jgi:16S rRNA (uracil1498-N3)-methyltransferase